MASTRVFTMEVASAQDIRCGLRQQVFRVLRLSVERDHRVGQARPYATIAVVEERETAGAALGRARLEAHPFVAQLRGVCDSRGQTRRAPYPPCLCLQPFLQRVPGLLNILAHTHEQLLMMA